MHQGRHLVADTHVQPPVIIEVDVAPDDSTGVFKGFEAGAVDTFHLYYTIGTFGYGIVRRLVVLGHGDADVVCPKHGHVCIAAVLHTAVGVMDQPFEGLAAAHDHGLLCRHLQGLYRNSRLERPGQRPSNNLVRVGIGDEVQVAHISVRQGDVGDVGHPQLVGGSGYEAPYLILVLVVAVVGVRRVAGLRPWKHQTPAAQGYEETVAAGHEVAPEHGDEHQPQLVATDAGILRADFPDSVNSILLMFHLFLDVGLRLVEGLTTMAKQPDNERHLQAALEDQLHCYLAPDFFRIWMSK